MYNPLLDDLPLDFEGLKLKTDFRQVLKFFRLQDDTELEQIEKYELTAMCFFDTPYLTQKMVDFIGWYIRGGEDTQEDTSSSEIVFDWNIDSYLIFAAFQQVYNIDLTEYHMHWWKFLALYKGLPNDTRLADVIKTRAMPIPKTDKYNQSYVKNLIDLKKYYAINKQKTEVGSQVQDLFGAI